MLLLLLLLANCWILEPIWMRATRSKDGQTPVGVAGSQELANTVLTQKVAIDCRAMMQLRREAVGA
jgi:hypothetical protein